VRPSRRVSLAEPRRGDRGVADPEPLSRDRSGRLSAPAFWRLLRIASAVTTTRHVTRALRAVAFEAAALCRADRCALFVARGDGLLRITGRRVIELGREGRWPAGPPTATLDDVPGFARARRERKPVIVADPTRDGSLPPEWRGLLGPSPFVVLPLLQGGRFLGVMVLDNGTTGRSLGGIRLGVARVVADQVALALDHGRLVRTTRTLIHEAEALLNVGTTVASSLDLAEVVRRITRAAARAVGADSAGVYVTREGDRYLEPLAAYHLPKSLLEGLRRAPLVRTEFDEILDRPRWTDDAPNDPAFRHPLLARFPVRSLLLMPLRVKDSRVGLLVCAWWSARRIIKPDELRLMEAIAGQAAVAIEAAWLARRTAEVAVGRERTRMDGLLHDTLSSTLFGLALKLDSCLHRADCSDELRARLESVKQHAKTMMGQIRGLVAPQAV
jgi:GAF domain-containing protein